MIALLGVSIVTGSMFAPARLESPAYVVQGVEQASTAGGTETAAEPPVTALLASADIARGENQFRKCAACHSIERGGAQGIGPNLWGIVGANHARVAGFGYSSAMAETRDKVWDWEGLSEWLRNPRGYIPGNKMSFAGLSRAQDRADLLVYLNSMSDSPKPLPAAPEPAEIDEAPIPEEVPVGDADPVAVEVIPTA
jgi:cytochrome c